MTFHTIPDGASDSLPSGPGSSPSSSYTSSPSRKLLQQLTNQELGQSLRISVCANQGGRKYMEDRLHVEVVRDADGNILYTYAAIYDGHGGAEASEYVRQHLLSNIQSQSEFDSKDDDDILEAIRRGFLQTHHAMWRIVGDWPRTASGYASTAGTTASCVFIRNGKLYMGHVGDSAIFLGKRNEETNGLEALRLTVDHKPESAEEERRISEAGGSVSCKAGVMRVVWTRPIRGHVGPMRRSTPTESIPFLAVARSLGDLWSYNETTKEFVVSPDPDVSVVSLSEDDYCLILGSDGLTNVIRPMQAVSLVHACDQRCLSEYEFNIYEVQEQPNHARRLVQHALQCWNRLRADNISTIAIVFDKAVDLNEDDLSVDEVIDPNVSLNDVLADFREAVIAVQPHANYRLQSERVSLRYVGAMDNNFCAVNFRGPGFIRHEEELMLDGFQENNEWQCSTFDKTLSTMSATRITTTMSIGEKTEVVRRSRTKRTRSSSRELADSEQSTTESEHCSDEEHEGPQEENSRPSPPQTRSARRALQNSLTPQAPCITPPKQTTPLVTRASARRMFVTEEGSVEGTAEQVDISIRLRTPIMTRSREKATFVLDVRTTPRGEESPPSHFFTPSSRLLFSAQGSRKRPRSEGTTLTPAVSSVSLDSSIHLPSTPTRPVRAQWASMSKLGEYEEGDEPLPKRSRLWQWSGFNFFRRLIGNTEK